jgi:nuclear cap-binding protein subunit 1
MAAVVFEQPHKIPLLAGVIQLTNFRKPSVGQFVIEMVHSKIQDAIDNGEYNKLKVFTRFIASMCPVAGLDAISGLLNTLISRAIELQQNSAHRVGLAESLLVTVLLALPGFVQSAGADRDAAIEHAATILEKSKEFNLVEDAKLKELISPFVAENDEFKAPYEIHNFVTLTRTALANVSSRHWQTDNLIDIPALVRQIAKERQLTEQKQHTFPAVNIPAADDLKVYREWFYRTPRLYFQCYLTTNVESVPSPDSLEGVMMRDIASDIIVNIDFNRKEVTRQLITLDLFFSGRTFAEPGIAFDKLEGLQKEGLSTWKVEDVALEAILDAMFRLPDVKYPNAYLHAVLIEACIMAPQAIAPVFGRAIRFMYSHVETLDAELFFRCVDWFSQHLSNFAFTWKWKEWVQYASLPEDHPKRVFVQQLILKEVCLSYPQRVRETLPEEYLSFVPNIPDEPSLSYLSPDSPYESLVELLVAAAKEEDSEQRTETIHGVLSELRDKIASHSVGVDAVAADKEFITILVLSVCHAGNRSPSHARGLITKSANILRTHIKASEDRVAAIDAIRTYWKFVPSNAFLVLDFFADESLIERRDIVEHILDPRNNVLISSHGWESLTRELDVLKCGDAEQRASVFSYLPRLLSRNLQGAKDWQYWWQKRIAKALLRRYHSEVAESAVATNESGDLHEPIKQIMFAVSEL